MGAITGMMNVTGSLGYAASGGGGGGTNTMTLIDNEVVGKTTASTTATFNLVNECGFSMNSGDVILILGFVDDGGATTYHFSESPSWLTEICGNAHNDNYSDSRPVLFAGICNGTDELADLTFTLSASDKGQFFCWQFRSSNAAATGIGQTSNIFTPTQNIDMAGTYSVSPYVTGGSPGTGKQRIGLFFAAEKPDGANANITPITTSPSSAFTSASFSSSLVTDEGGTATNAGQSWYSVMTSSDTLGSETLASSSTNKGTMLYAEVDVTFSTSVLDTAYLWFDADDWAGATTAISNRGMDGSRYTLLPNSGIALGTNSGGDYFDAQTAGDELQVLVNGGTDIPDGDKLHLPKDFTIMIAHKVDSSNHSARLVDLSSSGFSANGWSIRRRTTDAHYDFHANDSGTETDAAEKEINNTAWAWSGAHEIWAMSMNTSGDYVQYEDATSVASGTSTSVRDELRNETISGIKMSFFNWPHSSTRASLGRIYGIAIWDRVLTSTEITAVYNYYSARMV